MSPLSLIFVVFLLYALVALLTVTICAWLDARSSAKHNMKGWENAAYRFKEECNKSQHLNSEVNKILKIANDNAAEAEAYRSKLQKYGLDDQP